MSVRPDAKARKTYWHLYWVATNDYADSFVAARSRSSARRVVVDYEGFDNDDVAPTRILRIPLYLAPDDRNSAEEHGWPGYVPRELLEKLGAEFRKIDGVEEMLLRDTVYRCEGDFYFESRTVGQTNVKKRLQDPELAAYPHSDEDEWDGSQAHLLTTLGMCVARCQQVEYYLANSFLLAMTDKNRGKGRTLNESRTEWERLTVGAMFRRVTDTFDIEPARHAVIELFIKMRNELVHGVTTKERYDIRTGWGQKELVVFLSVFDGPSRAVRDIFRGSFLASLAAAAKIESVSMPFEPTKSEWQEIMMFFEMFKPKAHAKWLTEAWNPPSFDEP